MRRSLFWILNIALLAAALVYAGVLLATRSAELRCEVGVCGRLLLARVRNGQLELAMLKPDDPDEARSLHTVAALTKFGHATNSGQTTLPKFRPYYGRGAVSFTPWQWIPRVPGGVHVDLDTRRFEELNPPLVVMLDTPPGYSPLSALPQPIPTTSFFVAGSMSLLRVRPWFGFVVLLAGPAATAVRTVWLLQRTCARRRRGCCLRCGYNLTGLPQPRCPECGAEFQHADPEPGAGLQPPRHINR